MGDRGYREYSAEISCCHGKTVRRMARGHEWISTRAYSGFDTPHRYRNWLFTVSGSKDKKIFAFHRHMPHLGENQMFVDL